MYIEKEVISELKQFINRGYLDEFKEKWNEYYFETDFGKEIAWDFIFQKIYLHTALKKQRDICEWLDIVFTNLDPIQQIALRQMFAYARHLLSK